MDQNKLTRILSIGLNQLKNGSTQLKRGIHCFPAIYILYLEECGKYYIGSTGGLYKRIYDHLLKLKLGKHNNGRMQKAFDSSTNKTIRVSFVRTENRKEAFDLEQKLLDKHIPSGLLFNVFTNAETNGHGGKWSQEAKEKQSKVGKNNADTGKLSNAWKATSKAVSIDGIVYSSLSIAAKELGVDYFTLCSRFRFLKDPNNKSQFRGKYFYI